MEINIFDYVTEEDIRQEILSGIRYTAMNMSEKDFERVMTNAFYGTVSNIANEIFEERGFKEEMENKIKEIINGLSAYNVFRDKDGFNNYKSKSQILLDQIVEEQKEILKDRVTETFDVAYRGYKANQDIAQILSDHVYEIFSIKKTD